MNIMQWSIEDWAALIAVLAGIAGFTVWMAQLITKAMRQVVREMIAEIVTKFNNLTINSNNIHAEIQDKNTEQDRRLDEHGKQIDNHEGRLSKVEGILSITREDSNV